MSSFPNNLQFKIVGGGHGSTPGRRPRFQPGVQQGCGDPARYIDLGSVQYSFGDQSLGAATASLLSWLKNYFQVPSKLLTALVK